MSKLSKNLLGSISCQWLIKRTTLCWSVSERDLSFVTIHMLGLVKASEIFHSLSEVRSDKERREKNEGVILMMAVIVYSKTNLRALLSHILFSSVAHCKDLGTQDAHRGTDYMRRRHTPHCRELWELTYNLSTVKLEHQTPPSTTATRHARRTRHLLTPDLASHLNTA